MKRTKAPRKLIDVVDASPLYEDDDLDNPEFLRKVENDHFKSRERSPMSMNFGTEIKFKNDFMRQVYYLARLGARNPDIANFFGVALVTIEKWKERNEDFRLAWEEGHWMFGMKVGETLGQKALGYDYVETEYSEHIDRQGRLRKLKKETHKHMPPSDVAIIFYLKNRFRDSWADVNKTEIDARVNLDITKRLDMTLLSEAEQKMIKSIALKTIIPQHGVSE